MTRGVHPSVTARERKGESPLVLCRLATRARHLRHVGQLLGERWLWKGSGLAGLAAAAAVPSRGVRAAGWTGSEMGRPAW
jgi:hypothetical protein